MPTRARGDGDEAGGGRRPVVAAVRAARWILFALLLASAGLTLFGLPDIQRAVAAGRFPPLALAVGPALLGVFAVGYAAYRLALVREGRYPAGKALVRIALLAAVAGAVAGLVRTAPDARVPGQGPVELGQALLSSDPESRALAAEVARFRPRPEALEAVPRLVAALEDPSPEVRRQARASLVALAGTDAGGEGPDAPARWRDYWRRAGR